MAFVCAVFLGFDLDIDDEEQEIEMCKVVNDFRNKCIKEGKDYALREFVLNLHKLSYSVLDICKMRKASEKTVNNIIMSLGN